jgi:hypothetical protein
MSEQFFGKNKDRVRGYEKMTEGIALLGRTGTEKGTVPG